MDKRYLYKRLGGNEVMVWVRDKDRDGSGEDYGDLRTIVARHGAGINRNR